ncbi:heat shock protein 70 [Neocallimastix lanati (nom. inval.)]|uniref:Heat shock protein 70 n=1 Tax=Neocallimastix californiae TaxID=1754190 RepID=A0A1Y2DJB5_9FUNG|nr:heat shock protein 70 [Neocallimastix sp. JGI-2020a]ORY59343.1 heat shock protein 70 [Neocallimastix californiae]|eukprot:ORY59343.1 heat shock protein 70 [Neocallimastix californiae]
MSVVGIDFGNLNTVIAVARNRGIDVVCNEVSNRKTPSQVSFGPKQRYLGESAKTQENSNFKNTVSQLKRLIGRQFSDPEVQQIEAPFINAPLVEGDRGEVAVKVMYQYEQKVFTFTQLVAMYLGKIKDITSAELKIPVSDCVISVPGWFTEKQRRALVDAASITGLNVLRLLNDTTASALGYGITKTDLPDPSLPNYKPKIVAFVDIGHSNAQVSIVSFVKGKLTVKGTSYNPNFGGRNLDMALVKHCAEQIKEKYKMDVLTNPKATFRLRTQCEKTKKILSANPVTILNVENIMNDRDVSITVKRDEFEELIKPYLDTLEPLLQDALKVANVTIDDIDSVELVGGTTRIPSVKKILNDFFSGSDDDSKSKLSTTLNQDECVARGCAFMCAIHSPVFRVRDFTVQDCNDYPIEINWDNNAFEGPVPEGKIEIFSVGNSVPSAKRCTFTCPLANIPSGNSVSCQINGYYNYEKSVERGMPRAIAPAIGEWTINNIKPIENLEAEKVNVTVIARLNQNGFVEFTDPTLVEEVMVENEGEENGEAMETEETEAEKQPKMKKVTRKHPLSIISKNNSLPTSIMNDYREAESQMAAQDKLVIDTEYKKNALEEYVYDTRSKVSYTYNDYVDPKIKDDFLKQLDDMEEWLYTDEGSESTKSVYVKKLDELKKIGDPIAFRYRESTERPQAEKVLRETIAQYQKQIAAGDGRYDHLTEEEMKKVTDELTNKLNWLNSAIETQNQKQKWEDLVVTSSAILKERETMAFTINPILNKPKPAPPKEEKKPETPAAEEKTAENTEEKPSENTEAPAAENDDSTIPMEEDNKTTSENAMEVD